MGGLATPPGQDDPGEQPARLKCRSDLEETLQADPRLIAPAGDLDFGLQAEQRGHAVCRSESRCREIAADGRHRADRRIGGAAGCHRKDVEFGEVRQRCRERGVSDGRADLDNVGIDPDRRQLRDPSDRDVMGLMWFMPDRRSHDPGATGEWGASGAAFVERIDCDRERTSNVDRSRRGRIHGTSTFDSIGTEIGMGWHQLCSCRRRSSSTPTMTMAPSTTICT